MNIHKLGLAILVMVLAGCGGPNIDAFERFQETPMANPTLSFAAPTEFSGSAGSSSGIQTQSSIDISFEIDESQMEQALAQLLAQAEAAGFEVEPANAAAEAPDFRYRSVGSPTDLFFGVRLFEGEASAFVILRQ